MTLKNFCPHVLNIYLGNELNALPKEDKPITVKHEALDMVGFRGEIPIYAEPVFIGLENMPFTKDSEHPDIVVSEMTARFFFTFAPWYTGRVYYPNTNPDYAKRNEQGTVIGSTSLIQKFKLAAN